VELDCEADVSEENPVSLLRVEMSMVSKGGNFASREGLSDPRDGE
jgi:hypothetical protein